MFTCKKESEKDAYYRRQTKFLVGICSRLTKQVVYQRRLLSSSCSWPAFLFPTSQVRLQWKVRRRYQRRFATIATKMPPQLATTSFRQRSEHSDLASITVAESFFYISRLDADKHFSRRYTFAFWGARSERGSIARGCFCVYEHAPAPHW